MSVCCGYNDLPHAVMSIFRGRADRPSRRKFRVQAVDIIDIQIAKPIVEQASGMDVGRALAKHDPHAVPLDQSPISCILPTDMEAEYVVEIFGASVDVGNSEARRPTARSLTACWEAPSLRVDWSTIPIWRHPYMIEPCPSWVIRVGIAVSPSGRLSTIADITGRELERRSRLILRPNKTAR